jgi:hypothetical protein
LGGVEMKGEREGEEGRIGSKYIADMNEKS